jgi:CheY-like chemotaxis protein
MCPQHLTWLDGCECCAVLRAGDGPLVLLTARADPDDAERNTPDWFPVTVVDLEA